MGPLVRTGLSCLALAVGGTAVPDRGRCDSPGGRVWPRIDQSAYAGSTKCAECHRAHYDGWKDTAHNKMIRSPVAAGPNQTVLADFSRQSPARRFE
jgi:hypothetical protein